MDRNRNDGWSNILGKSVPIFVGKFIFRQKVKNV